MSIFARFLDWIASIFIGTGVSKFVPFLNPVFETLYAKSRSEQLVETLLDDGSSLKVWNNDTCVGIFLLTKGEYEPFETKIIRQVAKDSNCFLDVGANVGYYTVQVAKLVSQVYAFEPDREIRELLCENIELNSLSNVDVYDLALAADTREVQFFHSTLHRGKSAIATDEIPSYTVKAVKLDDQVGSFKLVPDLIKVDIEGAEIDFLYGAKEFLSSNKAPIQLFVEYNPDSLAKFGYEPQEMISILQDYGFTMKILDEIHQKEYAYTPEKLDYVMSRTTYTNLWCTM